MRIRRIELFNYKGIKAITFEPNATTALIGINGAGKSTILQFIKSVWNGEELQVNDGFEFSLEIGITSKLITSEQIDELNAGLSNTELTLLGNTLDIWGCADKGTYKELAKVSPFISAMTEEAPLILIDNFDRSLKSAANVFKVNLNMSRKLMDTLTSSVRKYAEQMQLSALQDKWQVELNRLGCKILPYYSYGENRISYTKGLSLRQLSKGEQFVTTLAVMLTTMPTKGGILLIDEPETALHPKWRTQIIDWVHHLSNTQVIVATHDPLILQGLAGMDIIEVHKGSAHLQEYANIEELMLNMFEVEGVQSPAYKELMEIHALLAERDTRVLDLNDINTRIEQIEVSTNSFGIGLVIDFLKTQVCELEG